MRRCLVTVFFAFLLLPLTIFGQPRHPLYQLFKELAADKKIDVQDIEKFQRNLSLFTNKNNMMSDELQSVIFQIEGDFRSRFTPQASLQFQQAVALTGGKIRAPLELSPNSLPYWLKDPSPLANFQSRADFPERADIVVIGAGLTGASVAYHLAEAAKQGLRVVVIDSGDPATGASGRNGGNFELYPENFKVAYENLVRERFKFLKEFYPHVSDENIQRLAKRQAAFILQFGERNALRFKGIIAREKIDVDLSEAGWLRLTSSAAEQMALKEEIAFAKSLGINIELATPEQVFAETQIKVPYAGRMARGFGNYHPFKFVIGVLSVALKKGVELYTRTQVADIDTAKEVPVVRTNRGNIIANKVIVATNAFSAEIVPELKEIQPHRSQIYTLENVKNNLAGLTITENNGDLYYNSPKGSHFIDENGHKRGTLLVGGGEDRPATDARTRERSKEVFDEVRAQVDNRFPETVGQPPSRVWDGPMGFVRDRLPIIDFLFRAGRTNKSVVVAAGFNGYGGSFCVEAGYTAAQMALKGERLRGVPEDMFSLQRFSEKDPLYDSGNLKCNALFL